MKSEFNKILKPMVDTLSALKEKISEFPPLESAQRYGNKAFKQWHENMIENLDSHLEAFAFGDKELKKELEEYLKASFGSEVRIDYGTGHELNFFCILFILCQKGKIEKKQYRYLVQGVFYSYVSLMRELQTVYKLEPAGSHGVWGLDDYHFLPFIFGSAELIDHSELTPECVLKENKLAAYKDQYMYFDCIAFIKQVKTGSFHEHSPMLYDITAAANWGKVAKGMVFLYKDEVFKKFPVMQHFFTGKTIKLE